MEPIAAVHDASAAVLRALYESNQRLLDELQKGKDSIAHRDRQMTLMGTHHAFAIIAEKADKVAAVAAALAEKEVVLAAIVAEKDKTIAKQIASLDESDDTIERITDELNYFMQA